MKQKEKTTQPYKQFEKKWRYKLWKDEGDAYVSCGEEVFEDFIQALTNQKQELLEEWATAIYYSELGKGKLDQKIMENHLKRVSSIERGK